MLGEFAGQHPLSEALLHEPKQRRQILGRLRISDQRVHRDRVELGKLLGFGHASSSEE